MANIGFILSSVCATVVLFNRVESLNSYDYADYYEFFKHPERSLDLNYYYFTDIPESYLHNLRNLRILDLSHNNIRSIASGDFQHLESLEDLRLSNNNISHISSRMFASSDTQTQPSLRILQLYNNRLETLPRELLHTFPNLETISLAGNPWRCDRKLLFLSDAMAKTPNVFVDRDEVTCATPMELKGMKVADLGTYLLSRLTTEFTQTTLAQTEMTRQGKSSFPSPSDPQQTRQLGTDRGDSVSTERKAARAAHQQEAKQDKSSLLSKPSISDVIMTDGGGERGSGYLPSQHNSQLYTSDSESGSGDVPFQYDSQLHTADSESGSGSRPMSTEPGTAQATFSTSSPSVTSHNMNVEESKAPLSEGRSNSKTIIIGVSAGALGLVLTVVILAAVVRNVRRWKRVYHGLARTTDLV